MDDWEYSDDDCPKCSAQLAFRRCSDCDWDDYPDDDPEWPYEGPCDNCNGKGYEEWCRECGWDTIFKCFLSPQYEADWKEKQAALAKGSALAPCDASAAVGSTDDSATPTTPEASASS